MQKSLHETIRITEPGVYDYEGVAYTWRGGGNCGFALSRPYVMEIYADDVTVKNFGFRGAMSGIRIVDNGNVRKNVRLENVEGEACYEGFSLPVNFSGLWLKDVSIIVWSGDEAIQPGGG